MGLSKCCTCGFSMGPPKKQLTQQLLYRHLAPADLTPPARIFQISQRCSHSHPNPIPSSKLMEVKTGTWEVGGVPQKASELLTVFKVESVEIQAFHKVAQSLRLKSSHSRVTHLPEEPGRREKRERLSDHFWHESLKNPNTSCSGWLPQPEAEECLHQ